MFETMIEDIKLSRQTKLEDTFEELRRAYEWYMVAETPEAKKRYAKSVYSLSFQLADTAQVLYLVS